MYTSFIKYVIAANTNMIICFSDWVENKNDPVGRKKKEEKR